MKLLKNYLIQRGLVLALAVGVCAIGIALTRKGNEELAVQTLAPAQSAPVCIVLDAGHGART